MFRFVWENGLVQLIMIALLIFILYQTGPKILEEMGKIIEVVFDRGVI